MTDGNELLMGGGIKAAAFETLGATVVGTIVSPPKAQQARKWDNKTNSFSNEPDFWPSGDPKMQVVVLIQTDLRDPADATDDGQRNLYINSRMMPPVREAIRKTGAKGLEVGGRIAVQWSGGQGVTGSPKEWAADYARPAVDPGNLLGNGAQPAAAQAAPAAPLLTQPTAAAAPVAAAVSPVAQPLGLGLAAPAQLPPPPPGIDPTAWANLPEQQRQAVLAAMSNPAATAPPF